eukprot:s2547_g14.t1
MDSQTIRNHIAIVVLFGSFRFHLCPRADYASPSIGILGFVCGAISAAPVIEFCPPRQSFNAEVGPSRPPPRRTCSFRSLRVWTCQIFQVAEERTRGTRTGAIRGFGILVLERTSTLGNSGPSGKLNPWTRWLDDFWVGG